MVKQKAVRELRVRHLDCSQTENVKISKREMKGKNKKNNESEKRVARGFEEVRSSEQLAKNQHF